MSRFYIETVTRFAKSGECCVIYCCGGYHQPHKVVSLLPDFKYKERKLEVCICPVCNSLIAELTQLNVQTQKYEVFRPKRKKTSKFLKEIEAGKWNEIRVKYGSKSAAGFVFGFNIEAKDGKIYQYAVDFNGQKKLVKIVN